ncbi:SDR family oxidoreductase [Geminicoccaceae bacterium 1502E]|nr:SDR family oxidoreductase [Geminicoccaceae bacterium 1502E]
MSLSVDLASEVALVTGASSGLGRHFAELLARHGATVLLAARRLDRLEEVAHGIHEAGGSAHVAVMDVTSEESVEQAYATLEAAAGRPASLLVNNAGVAGPSRLALEVESREFAAVLDTDLTGAFRVARRAARALVAAGREGSVINVASILGLRTTPGVAAYEAAKAGLVHLTRALALEWARHGIRVNALAPGYILTDINRDFFETQAGQAIVRRIPQRRLGEPADLDGPLLLLASPASRYMTGTVLAVDGGHLTSSL